MRFELFATDIKEIVDRSRELYNLEGDGPYEAHIDGVDVIANFYSLNPNLEVSVTEFNINQHIEWVKNKNDDPDFFEFMLCTSQNIRMEADKKIQIMGSKSPNFAIFSNVKQEFSVVFPQHVPSHWIILRVRRPYFDEYVKGFPFLQKIINQKRPFIFNEDIDLELKSLMNMLIALNMKSRFAIPKAKAYSRAIITFFLERMLDRVHKKANHNISPKEYEYLMQVKEILTTRLDRPPTIDQLAHEVGMSTTKLKSSFKQVFGRTIYKYYQEHRMQRARELLNTGDYSVSEVGYKVGYTNLSHFSSGFKARYGILPKQYVLNRAH